MLYLGNSLEQILGTIHKVQLEKGLIGEIFSSYIEEGESCFDDTYTTIWLEQGVDIFMSRETADKPDISLNEGTREIDESLAIAISSLVDNSEVEGGIISVEYIADVNYRDIADKAKCLGLANVDLPDASIVRMSNDTICVLAKAFSYSAHQVSVPCVFETLEFNTIKFKNVKLGSDLTGLFKCLKCRTLDLSGLDLCETTNTSQMFSKAYIDKVIFGDNTTAKVNIMRGMFEEAHIGEIDFNAIKFDNASDIENIFNGFTGALIDGLEITVSNISSVQSIFEDTVVGKLKLNIPYGSKCRNLKRMFKNCNIKELEIGELVGALINDVTSTFEDCQIGKLKIGTLGLWRIANMYEMFNGITVDKNSIEVPKKIEYFIRASMEPMDNIKIKADYNLGGSFLA
jgi:hypothetical protein